VSNHQIKLTTNRKAAIALLFLSAFAVELVAVIGLAVLR
jgi:hypothetical protein